MNVPKRDSITIFTMQARGQNGRWVNDSKSIASKAKSVRLEYPNANIYGLMFGYAYMYGQDGDKFKSVQRRFHEILQNERKAVAECATPPGSNDFLKTVFVTIFTIVIIAIAVTLIW